MSTLYNGYVESDEQVALRWQRIKAREYAFDVYGAELTDEEADALRAALILCATDPAHILNTAQEVDDWMQRDDAAATYGERKPFEDYMRDDYPAEVELRRVAWHEWKMRNPNTNPYNFSPYNDMRRHVIPYRQMNGGDDDMPF
jgi:predicted lipoprotein